LGRKPNDIGSTFQRPIDEKLHKFKLSHAKHFKTFRNNLKRSQNGFKQIHPTQKTSDEGMYNDWQHFQVLTVFHDAKTTGNT